MLLPYLNEAKIHRRYKLLIVVAFHTLFVIIGYSLMHLLEKQNYPTPNNINLINFDAHWYSMIKESGYEYEPDVGNTLAFFPLFPLVWRATDFSPVCISIFNYVVFTISFILLLWDEDIRAEIILLLLSFPSFIFFGTPYSESLFFLFCVLILVGYKRKVNWLVCLGLFGACLARSVCVFFIPAIIVIDLCSSHDNISKIRSLLALSSKFAAAICGLVLSMCYLNYETGTWFYFIKIQRYWQRRWIVPDFPFTTLSPDRVLGVDAIAVVIGVLAIYWLIKTTLPIAKTVIFFKRYRSIIKVQADSALLFSAVYLCGITILDTCFTYNTLNSTNIWSVNRHLMCTPFTVMFLVYLVRDSSFEAFERVTIIVFFVSSIFLTGVYQYFNFSVLGFFLLFFLALGNVKYRTKVSRLFFLYYLVALFLQLQFFRDFITDKWLG